MGFFYNKLIKLAEAAPEDNDQTQPTDYTDSDNATSPDSNDNQDQTAANNDSDAQQSDANNDQNANDYNPDQNEPADYTQDQPDAEGDDSNSDDSYQQDQYNNDNNPPDDEEPVDDIKRQEEELYSNLTAEELDIKHRELKNQYLAMFDIISSLITRIGDVSIPEDSIPALEYISQTLIKLKDMVTNYVNFVYKTKSYIENSINYNKFLAVLNGINKILEEINTKDD